MDLTPVMGFEMGRCYTMSPKSGVKHVSQAEGYSMTMRHTARDLETTVSIDPPGYRVYIHYTREPFTGKCIEIRHLWQNNYSFILLR